MLIKQADDRSGEQHEPSVAGTREQQRDRMPRPSAVTQIRAITAGREA
jgi:hypothetical protein